MFVFARLEIRSRAPGVDLLAIAKCLLPVVDHGLLLGEPRFADVALEGTDASVGIHVPLQVAARLEPHLALLLLARVRPLAGVPAQTGRSSLLHYHYSFFRAKKFGRRSVAQFGTVPAQVDHQVALGREPHVAVLAPKGLCVVPAVRGQLGRSDEHLVAVLALVGDLNWTKDYTFPFGRRERTHSTLETSTPCRGHSNRVLWFTF